MGLCCAVRSGTVASEYPVIRPELGPTIRVESEATSPNCGEMEVSFAVYGATNLERR